LINKSPAITAAVDFFVYTFSFPISLDIFPVYKSSPYN
jgi:hypothetical protein